MAISQALENAQKQLEKYRQRDGVETAVNVPDTALPPIPQPSAAAPQLPSSQPEETAVSLPETVKVYPTLNAAILDNDQAAAGRVWYLMRAIDQAGRGWLDIDQVRELLTGKGQPFRVYGWRRLRQILNEGNCRFWDKTENDRIRYKSVAKVASELDCGRLQGQPVDLPINALLGGIQAVRAHFYASWHGGRKENNPIGRAKLRELTSVPESTQRVYDKVAGVQSKANWNLEPKTEDSGERAAWQGGNGSFRFKDWHGKVGERGREYDAWRLPNSYTACHAKSPKGRQKKINRDIDLVIKRARGIGSNVNRIFYQDGGKAGKAYNRNPQKDHYYRLGAALSGKADRPSKLAAYGLWACLPGA